MSERAHQESDLRRYPAGCDREVVAAVRHFLEETGRRPEQLDDDLGLNPGTIASLAAGYLEPPGPMIRLLCHWLRIPRWAFYLTGALVVGAEQGFAELAEILEKRRRQLDGNQHQLTDADLAVEAVERLLAIGEDDGAYPSAVSRGGLVAGVKRLGRRAWRLGELGASCLLEAVAVVVDRGVESLPGSELDRVVALVDVARSLEQALPESHLATWSRALAMASEQHRGVHERVASLMTSIGSSLQAAGALVKDEELKAIEDPELRRLLTILAERQHGTRLAFSAFERHYQRVYGERR